MNSSDNGALRSEMPVNRLDLAARLKELFALPGGKDRCRAVLSRMGLVPDGKTPVADLVPPARWGDFVALLASGDAGENVVEHPADATFRAWAESQDKTLLSLALRDYGGTQLSMVPVEQRQKFRADVESLTKPHPVDATEVRALAEQLRTVAGDLAGDFVFATLVEGAGIMHYTVSNSPGAVQQIVDLVGRIGAAPGANVYFAASLFKSGTVTACGGRTKANVVAVLGAILDFDGKHDPATRADRLPLVPGSELESSPGNVQSHYWLDAPPQDGATIELTLCALANMTGADDCKSTEHLWRVPGTWNWPTRKKVEAGRSVLPFKARWLTCPEVFDRVSVDDLRTAILEKDSQAFAKSPAPGGSFTSAPFDWDQRIHPDEPCKPLPDDELRKRLSAEGDRSALAWGAIKYLRQYRNYSAAEIRDTLWALADLPAMGHYSDDGKGGEYALRADVQRAFQKPDRGGWEDVAHTVYKHAVDDPDAVSGQDAEGPGWTPPVIKIQAGASDVLMRRMDAALAGSGADVFQSGGQLVRLREAKLTVRGGAEISDIAVVPFRQPVSLREIFDGVAQFQTWDGRMGDWKTAKLPEDALAQYLYRGAWSVRTLSGFITAPTLRPGGSLLSTPGYDRDTGLFYDPRGTAFPPIPDALSKDDAKAALAVFDELIGGFPFATAQARSVALAAFLTAPVRRTLPTVPLFGIDATAAGSGKGLLADIVSIVGVGRKASGVSVGASEEELEKRLGALLMQGEGFIVLDNVSAPIESDALCTILTQEMYQPRVLGQSAMPKVRTAAMIMATGNNLRFHGDMGRRALRCLIDPKMERPDLRRFDFDPAQRAADRGRYVAAALTVLRAYQAAGSPPQDGKTMGSFDQWCRVVRDALLWLGEADPVATVTEQLDDPRREQHVAVLAALETSIGFERDFTCGELVEAALNPEIHGFPELHKALLAVAAQQGGRNHGEVISRDRLGRWVVAHKLKIVDGRRIVPVGWSRNGVQQYRLEQVNGGP